MLSGAGQTKHNNANQILLTVQMPNGATTSQATTLDKMAVVPMVSVDQLYHQQQHVMSSESVRTNTILTAQPGNNLTEMNNALINNIASPQLIQLLGESIKQQQQAKWTLHQ